MNVTWSMVSQPGLASAPHALAWQYALNLVLAHAYTHEIKHLRCISQWQPITGLIEETLEAHDSTQVHVDALALFGASPPGPLRVHTVYVFDESPLGHANTVHLSGQWTLDDQYYLYTHRAKVFGLVMRMGRWLKRPDIEDWAVYGVRTHFVSKSLKFASYRLAIWVRE